MSNPEVQNKLNTLNILLQRCSYDQRCFFKIQNDTTEILCNYRLLEPGQTAMMDGFNRTLIEIKGDVAILYKDRYLNVRTFILFPSQYPQEPPIIKIQNIDPSKFTVNQKWAAGQMPNGFVKLNLDGLMSWNSHYNVMNLMKQFESELALNFPFFANRNSQNIQQNFPNNQQHQGFGINNSFGVNNQQYGSNNQFGQNNQSVNMQQNHQYGQPQQGMFGQLASSFASYLPFGGNNQQNVNQLALESIEKFKQLQINTCEKFNEEMRQQRKATENIIKYSTDLEIANGDAQKQAQEIQNSIQELTNYTQQLQEYFASNQQVKIDINNIEQIVQPQDLFSNQVMKLTAEIEVAQETIFFVETSFKQSQIDLNTMIQSIKKIASKEFNDKHLLIRCNMAINN